VKAEQVKRMREALASLVYEMEQFPDTDSEALANAKLILTETMVWVCQGCELTTYDAPPNMDRQKAYDTGKNARKCPRCKSEGALVIQGW
jgi:Zn finger protein HypA/HybF involved in hydrogenase expression